MTLAPIAIDPERILQDENALPSLPELTVRILSEINAGSSGFKVIAGLIEKDPALVAQILRIVNSAYFALPVRIRSAQHAVAYLGLAEIHKIVLGNSVLKTLQPSDEGVFREIWQHSFYVAVVAKHLANTFERQLNTDDLYSAALLHDIGKLVYIKLYPKHYCLLAQMAKQRGHFVVELERELGIPTHLMLGGLLCKRWQLPETIRMTCENHELDALQKINSGEIDNSFIKLITVANLMTHPALGSLNESLRVEVTRQILSALGCSEGQFLLLLGDVYDLKAEVSTVVNRL